MKKKYFIFIIMLITTFVFAQEDTEKKKEQSSEGIVISARGYKTLLTLTPGGIGILTAEDIEKLDPVSISDVMQNITGVYKSSDSAWGSEISIRGTTRDKVILIIDGSRVNTATDIGAQFGTLDPMSVEKIEILKGPISSLYGSGTIGGVVNVVTRTGKFTETPGFKSGISVSGDSISSGYNAYAFTSYNSPGWYVFASGSYRDHDNYEDGNGDEIYDSGFKDVQGTVNLGFKFSPNHIIEIRSQYYEGKDIGIPGAKNSIPETATSAENTKLPRGLVSLDYIFLPNSGFWQQSKLHLYYQYIGRNVCIINQGTPDKKLEPEADHKTTGGQWTNVFTAGHHTIVAGLDSWIRTYEGYRVITRLDTGAVLKEDKPLPDCSYLSNGIFAEDDWKLGDLTINFGGRWDIIKVANDKTYNTEVPETTVVRWEEDEVSEHSWNAHLGLTYIIFKPLTTSILAASGYRAASLEERYKYIALGTVEHWGNPDLEPERSYFFEYALHLGVERLKANASVYANILRNLIAEKQTSSTRYDLDNIDEALLRGGECDLEIKILDPLSVHGNISYVRGEDTKNDTDLPSIAPLRITGGIKYSSDFGFSAFFDSVYTAKQDKVPDGMDESESWVRLDAGISWKFKISETDHRIFVNCTNIMNKTYYDYLTMSQSGYSFNEPGRSFKAGYSVLF